LTGGVSAGGLKDVTMVVKNHSAKNFVAVEGSVLVAANSTDSGVVATEGTKKGIQELCGGRLGFGGKDPSVASSGINDEQVADISLATSNDFGSRIGMMVDDGAEIGRATNKTEIHVEHLAGFQGDLVDDKLSTRGLGQVCEVASAAMHEADGQGTILEGGDAVDIFLRLVEFTLTDVSKTLVPCLEVEDVVFHSGSPGRTDGWWRRRNRGRGRRRNYSRVRRWRRNCDMQGKVGRGWGRRGGRRRRGEVGGSRWWRRDFGRNGGRDWGRRRIGSRESSRRRSWGRSAGRRGRMFRKSEAGVGEKVAKLVIMELGTIVGTRCGR
jgi:hypothetical protein